MTMERVIAEVEDAVFVDAMDQYLSGTEWTQYVRQYVDNHCGLFADTGDPDQSDHGHYECFVEVGFGGLRVHVGGLVCISVTCECTCKQFAEQFTHARARTHANVAFEAARTSTSYPTPQPQFRSISERVLEDMLEKLGMSPGGRALRRKSAYPNR